MLPCPWHPAMCLKSVHGMFWTAPPTQSHCPLWQTLATCLLSPLLKMINGLAVLSCLIYLF